MIALAYNNNSWMVLVRLKLEDCYPVSSSVFMLNRLCCIFLWVYYKRPILDCFLNFVSLNVKYYCSNNVTCVYNKLVSVNCSMKLPSLYNESKWSLDFYSANFTHEFSWKCANRTLTDFCKLEFYFNIWY